MTEGGGGNVPPPSFPTSFVGNPSERGGGKTGEKDGETEGWIPD